MSSLGSAKIYLLTKEKRKENYQTACWKYLSLTGSVDDQKSHKNQKEAVPFVS